MAVVGFEEEQEEEEGNEEEKGDSDGNKSSSSPSSVPLAVLQLAPPGTEATIALPALAAFLSPASLAPLLARADRAVEALAAAPTSPLAAAAGRFGRWERLTTRKDGEGIATASSASVKSFAKAALEDYAATWLGMMVKEGEEGDENEGEEEEEKEEKKSAAMMPRPLPFRLADPAGSRLPLPPWGGSLPPTSWVLADVCPRGVASAARASEAVGRALTLALALLLIEERPSSKPSNSYPSSSSCCCSPSSFAASVADLLLGGDSGVVRGDSEAWRNPRARWAVAALSEKVLRSDEEEGGGGSSQSAADVFPAAAPAAAAPATKITPARATGWASSCASDTFGDALCGGLVAAAALLSSSPGSGGGGEASSSSSSSSASAASAAAVAAFDVLEESDALSSLPGWEAAVFAPPASSGSFTSFRLPTQLASRAANALAAGRLDRAIDEVGGGGGGEGGEGSKEAPSSPSSPSLALSDAVAWLREQCLAVAAKEIDSSAGSSGSINPPPADPAAAAAALRHFLAQARPKHVAALLLLKSPCCGGDGSKGRETDDNNDDLAVTLKALRSASGGNEALENKVKEAEKMMMHL